MVLYASRSVSEFHLHMPFDVLRKSENIVFVHCDKLYRCGTHGLKVIKLKIFYITST